LQTDNGLEFSNSQLNNYCINNDIKNIHGFPKHPQSQEACESCHKEIKKYIYNKYLENKNNLNIISVVREITNIHNSKKYFITREIPSEIRDLNDDKYILKILQRMNGVITKKNINIDIKNFDGYYVINSDLIIKGNKLIKNNKKKKIKSKCIKIPVVVHSEIEKDSEVLIELKKIC